MKIFAHRGFFNLNPENSASAIMEAIYRGFAVETDIRFTKDMKMALIHDDTLTRLCGVKAKVKDLHSKEISNLSFLSRTEESLKLFDELAPFLSRNGLEASIAVHFKQEEQGRENCLSLSRLFKRYNLYENCFVFNLSLETCRILRDIDPGMNLGVLVSDKKFESFVYLWDELERVLNLFDIVWAAEYKSLYNDDFFMKIKGSGKQIIAVSNELHRELDHPKAFFGYKDSWISFLKNRIDGVCTDYPIEFYRYMSFRNEALLRR